MTTPTFSDYAAMFRRRKAVFLMPFLLLSGAAVAAALLIPAEYESTASIRIDRQETPENVVGVNVVTRYVNEQLDALDQKVMTGDNFWAIAEEFDLFPELREEGERGEVVRNLRSKTRREVSYVDVGEEDRRGASVAVGFTVTHASRDPETASQVVNAVADLYIAANHEARRERARRLTAFLQSQMDEVEQRVAEYEEELAVFRSRHAASLPEFTQFNMQRTENIQDQLDRVDENINALEKQRIDLEAQIAQVDPQVDIRGRDRDELSAAQQVDRLRVDYLTMSSRYAPRHPDFGRLRRELEALTGETPTAGQLLELIGRAEEVRARLLEARRELGDDDSQVAQLARTAGQHRERIRGMSRAITDSGEVRADNPAYIALKSRIDAVESELESERQRRESLRARVSEFDSRLVGSAGVERDYSRLVRQHNNALAEQRELREKLLQARNTERLEANELGEHFTLTSRGTVPEYPARPQRLGIAALGFIVAAGTSTGFAALAEYADRTLRGARAVAAVWGAPPLAAIPVILNRRERLWRFTRRLFWLLLFSALIGAGAWYWMAFHAPPPGSGL